MLILHKSRIMTWFLTISCCTVLIVTSPWLHRMLFGVRTGVNVAGVPVGGMIRTEVTILLAEIALTEYKPPVDATIDRETGEIISERRGSQVDVIATVDALCGAGPGEVVGLVIAPVDPRVLSEQLRAAVDVIGTYTTAVGGSDNRVFNIGLATSFLDYVVIEPGGLFSFNGVVGPRTYELGYKPAPVLVEGGSVLDAGGGVCQVSSTLYNAALAAGMEIVERSPHSRPVSYVPPGRDATVVYGAIDLKFVNPRSSPIVVRGSLEGRELRIWITGIEENSRM